MKFVDYSQSSTPDWYKCDSCGASGCKIWRDFVFFPPVPLLCANCAAENQGKSIDDIDADGMRSTERGRTNLIGSYRPAIPIQGEFAYWGQAPDDGVDWWRSLPTLIERK